MDYNNHTARGATAPTLLTLAGLILATGCNVQEVPSHWSTQPVQVDGKTTDWSNKPMTFFQDEGVALGLSNDAENLCILFRFQDPKWARTIRMTGLTLWLDVNGKKGKNFMIRYKGGPSLARMRAAGEGGDLDHIPPELNECLMRQEGSSEDRFTCFVKDRIIEKSIPTDGSQGPAASYDTSLGFYSYEFSVPLQESEVRYYGIGAQPGQTISIGAVWGNMSNLRGKGKGRSGMNGGRGGMGGGPPDRGRMGGGRGSKGGGRMQPPEKQEVWVKTQLALSSAEVF